MKTIFKLLASGALGGASDPATGSGGQQVFLIIGDSIAVGQGATVGPTPTTGTVKEWNGSALVNVTTTDLSTSNVGSPWPRFGIDYNARTGKIPVFVNTASGGSEFYPNGDNNNWYTTGTLYAAMQTKVANALAAIGASKPKGIFLILGINDFTSSNTFTDINTGIDSFFTRIAADFPNVPIYMAQVGRDSSSIVSRKQSQIRNKLRQVSEANSHIHILNAPVAMYDYGYYKVDLIHYAQSGNDFFGAAWDNYMEDIATYEKIACNIFSSFKDSLNSTKKAAINAFVSTYKNSNIPLLETFQIYKGDTQANTYLDWVGNLAPVETSISFSANTEIATSGATGSFIDTMWMADQQFIRVPSDQDVTFGVRMGTKTTADGVLACLFGCVGSADNTTVSIFQTTTPSLQWRVMEDGGTSTILTTAPDTKFIAQSMYELVRTGASACSLWKDGVKLQDGTTAYEGTIDRAIKLGGRSNAASTVSNPIAAGFKCFYVATNTGFDRMTWDADLDTLLAAL